MAERNYYVVSGDNCLFEALTKEQTLAAIEQAVNTGRISDVDAGFVTKIKEQNKGAGLKFWVGTQAEYNAVRTKQNNCFYIITDSPDAVAQLQASVDKLQASVDTLSRSLSEKFTNDVLFESEEGIPNGDFGASQKYICGTLEIYDFVDIKWDSAQYYNVRCRVQQAPNDNTLYYIFGSSCGRGATGADAITLYNINLQYRSVSTRVVKNNSRRILLQDSAGTMTYDVPIHKIIGVERNGRAPDQA